MHKLSILIVALPLACLPAAHSHPFPRFVQQDASAACLDGPGKVSTDLDAISSIRAGESTGTIISARSMKDALLNKGTDHLYVFHQPQRDRSLLEKHLRLTDSHPHGQEARLISKHTPSLNISLLQGTSSAIHSVAMERLEPFRLQQSIKKTVQRRLSALYKRDDIEPNTKRNTEKCHSHGWMFADLAEHHPSGMVGPFVGLFMSNTILWLFIERISKLLRANQRTKSRRRPNTLRSLPKFWIGCQKGYRGTRERKADFFDDMLPEDLLGSHRANMESYARCQSRLAEIETLINGITDPSRKAAWRRQMLPKYLGLATMSLLILAAVLVVALIPLAWNATYYCPDQVFFDPIGAIVFFTFCLASAVVPLVFSCFKLVEAALDVRRAKRKTRFAYQKKFTSSRMLTDDGGCPSPFEAQNEEIPLQRSSRIPTPSSRYTRSVAPESMRSATPRSSIASTVVPSVRSVGRPQPTAPMPRERLTTRGITCAPRTTKHMASNSLRY